MYSAKPVRCPAAFATARGVRASNATLADTSMSRSRKARCSIMTFMESPPSAKKSSSKPTFDNPRTSS